MQPPKPRCTALLVCARTVELHKIKGDSVNYGKKNASPWENQKAAFFFTPFSGTKIK